MQGVAKHFTVLKVNKKKKTIWVIKILFLFIKFITLKVLIFLVLNKN